MTVREKYRFHRPLPSDLASRLDRLPSLVAAHGIRITREDGRGFDGARPTDPVGGGTWSFDLGEVAAAAREAPDLFPRFAAEVLRWIETRTAAADSP